MARPKFATTAREAVFLRPQMPKKPPCFETQEQFDEWQNVAWKTGLNERFGFCMDCTPLFKVSEYLKGNCLRPDVKFVNGDGVVPLKPSRMAKQLMEKWNWC